MNEYETAREAGRVAGAAWEGPHGDGTLGSLSLTFIRDGAEQQTCGFLFRELRDGPSQHELDLVEHYLDGFMLGWRNAQPRPR